MGEDDRGRSFIRRQRPDLGDEGRRVEEPEPQDESQRLADARVKLEIGVPREQVLTELGYAECSR